MKKTLPVLSILFMLLFAFSNKALAVKVPTINYATPQVYTKGTAITPLTPTSTGIAAPGFSSTATAVGSGFNHPHGIAFDAAGNVYVAELSNGTIKKIPKGGGTPVIIGTGFISPQSLAVDAAGDVYVVDESKTIKIIPSGGGAVTTMGVGFDAPSSITIDSKGNIYVTDSGAVKVFPPGSNSWSYLGNQLFGNPIDAAVDGAGNVFVADYGSGGVIREFHVLDGTVTVLHSGFANLVSIDVDGADNVFVADAGNNVIDELPAGSSTLVPIGSGFSGPESVNLDAAGNVYVSDYNNNAVKIIKPVGGCFISPFLPQGLTFNNTTGVISGTPAVLSPATNYTVTAYNAGGSKTAALNIVVTQPASDASLSALKLSSVVLSPVFTSGNTSYTGSVSNTLTSLKVTPTATIANATIKVNGVVVASGTASAAIPLVVGPNVVTTTVTSQDGSKQQTYTVTVTRAKSGNANLSKLVINKGTLTPAFNTDTINYTATVSNATTSFTLKPTTAAATATVTVKGMPVASNSNSPGIPLAVGVNIIPIVVTAQDGTTTKTYTLSVTRTGVDVVTLASLKISNGTLAPVFGATKITYKASVGNSIATMTVTPTATDANATVKVNGILVISGSASAPIPLSVGANVIAIVVTGQSGTTTKTYTLTVTKAASAVATLASLKISNVTLSPVFGATKISYKASVSNTLASIIVTPTTTDANATVKVNGTIITSGIASAPIPLLVGPNIIAVVVTAQNGTDTKTYTLTITKAASAVATLASLKISNGTLSPVFAATKISYNASVSNSVTSVKITPVTTDENATVKVNGINVVSGSSSAAISLVTGVNTITAIVTAQNGTSTKTYTIKVNRAAPTDNSIPTVTINLPATTLSTDPSLNGTGTSVAVKVYPNPATAIFNLQISNGDYNNKAVVMVRNLQGKIVYQKTGDVYDDYTFGQNFAAGIYIAQVTNGKFIKQVKLIKSLN